MLNFSRATRVFLATGPTDLRKGFDGLFGLVESVIEQDPFSGHLFVFRNQRRDRLKVLWWDRDGLAIFYKRLERGCYEFPTDRASHTTASNQNEGMTTDRSSGSAGGLNHPARCEIRADELALLLEGIDLGSVKRRLRYQRPTVAEVKSPTSSL